MSELASQAVRVSKWAWRWQAVDYGWLLPLMAKLPYTLAHTLAMWRGAVHAKLGRDWAELSVGIRYVAERTRNTAQLLWPTCDADDVVTKRYQFISREEWHASMLAQGTLQGLNCKLDTLQDMLSKASPNKGLVVLTAHFDSFIVGMVGLGFAQAVQTILPHAEFFFQAIGAVVVRVDHATVGTAAGEHFAHQLAVP